MRKTAILAKRLAALAKTDGPLFVLANSQPALKKVEMAYFACAGCKTGFHAEKDTFPFCITCGSENVSEKASPNGEGVKLPETDENMAACQCASCSTFNTMTNAVATAYNGEIHCVTCGEAVEYEMEPELDELESEPEMEEVDTLESSEEEIPAEDESVAPVEETPAPSADDNVVAEAEDEGESTEETPAEETPAEETPAEEEGEEESEESLEEEGTEFEESNSDEDEEFATIKPLEFASGEFNLEVVGNRMLAFVGDTQVATLTPEVAGENANLLHSTTFAAAITHSAKQMGVAKALAHYGFKSVELKMPVNKTVTDRVAAALADEKKKIEAKNKSFVEDFKHSLQIAAAGLNKSFFKDCEHVLKANFFDELTTAGMRKPAKVIDKVFAASSDAYHSVLLEKAFDLMSKPEEVRNEIAKAVGLANYQEAEETDEMDDDESFEESDNFDDALETSGVKPVLASRKNHGEKIAVATVREVASKHKGKLFTSR